MLTPIVEVVAPVLHANVFEPVPPAGVAVSVAGSVFAHCSTFATETVGFGFTVSVPEPEPVQPFVSVTVTEKLPDTLELMVEVVAPVLQANVLEPVPPDGVAVRTPGVALWQTATFPTETVGLGSSVRVPEPDPVHPLVSVTVTEYAPAALVLIVEVVAPVLHANVLDPVPPEGVPVNVAGTALAHISTLPTETVGLGSTVSVPEPEPVHPFVSVTVTE